MVTPYSHLHFRLLDHSTFRKDGVLGEKKLSLYDVLAHYSGRCEHLEVTMDLMSDSKHEYVPPKVGDLILLLNGLKIDMATCPPETAPRQVTPLGKMFIQSYFG